jgi:hypothetical protein
MMKINPVTWWITEFGHFSPAGHGLRQEHSHRWTRFHSLPDSKRYPEIDAEYFEIIKRHTTVACELFVAGEPIFVYRSRPYEQRLKGKSKHTIVDQQLREFSEWLPAVVTPEPTEKDDLYSVRALVTTWPPKFFNTLIRLVADDKLRYISFVSPVSKNIYCPYDGGMDIFTFPGHLKELEIKYRDWQSKESSKL